MLKNYIPLIGGNVLILHVCVAAQWQLLMHNSDRSITVVYWWKHSGHNWISFLFLLLSLGSLSNVTNQVFKFLNSFNIPVVNHNGNFVKVISFADYHRFCFLHIYLQIVWFASCIEFIQVFFQFAII